MTGSRRFFAELAWLGGVTPAADVLIKTLNDRIVNVQQGVPEPADAVRLDGLTLPGLANTHSHVYLRALRGHTQSGVADFWAWRQLMYQVANRLNPDSLYDLAYATYVEMALSGITSVGEFHYVHHDVNGSSYADPNEMSHAVIRAATDAGLRITLLDTCYLQGDILGSPLSGVQRRFGDKSWENWSERVEALAETTHSKTGAAIHSVRAVPRSAFAPIAEFATRRNLPLHVHVSEQPAENDASLDAYGMTPTELLADAGVLGRGTTAVHATHLTATDINLLGKSGTTISMCCTTERDLADGVGPATQLARAGSPLAVGSDAHMVIDLWEEARAMELDERLVTGIRGHLMIDELLTALTRSGSSSLGWDAGRIAPGALADMVTVALDSPRTAGARAGDPLAHVIFAATGSDVSNVIVGGVDIVENGRHLRADRPGALLESAIEAVLS